MRQRKKGSESKIKALEQEAPILFVCTSFRLEIGRAAYLQARSTRKL